MKLKKQRRIIFVVPQQHWDPFWSFAPEISERMGVRNVRKVLDIMKENPNFKYVIGQAYLWELFKKYFPERCEELKKRVKEGRIELANGAYVNPDFNLPSGESLIRNLTYCQKVWQKDFGVKSEVVWIQDSFGQSAQLPQIFRKIGLKYHTAKRGTSKDLPAVFIWQGVDGSQIIFDRQPLGHHGILQFPPFSALPNKIKPNEKFEKFIRQYFALPFGLIAIYLPDLPLYIALKGKFWRFKSALRFLSNFYPNNLIFVPHGFGADGAMPFEWIVYLTKLYSKLSGDKMFISLPSEFFREIEKMKDNLLVIKGELNGPTEKDGEAYGALPGTYSTRIEVKQTARENERMFYLAEILEALKFLKDGEGQDLIELWKLKFLTDFHDGICGSLTDINYQVLREKSLLLRRELKKIISQNFQSLASKNNVVFNPLPWPRKDLVKFDHQFKIVEVNSLGFNLFKEIVVRDQFSFDGQCRLTTPFYRIRWTINGLEIYQKGKKITGSNFARIRLQNEKGDTYFWDVSGEEWNKIDSIKLIEWKGLRATIEIKSRLGKNKITQLIHFYLHTPRIDFETTIDNQEKDVRIQVYLPFNLNFHEIIREIPAGFITCEKHHPQSSASEYTNKPLPIEGQAKWKDVFGEKYAYYDNIKCVQNWIYFGNQKEGIAIFNDGLPEHEIINNSFFITLLRCVGRVGTEGKGLNKYHLKNSVPWRAGSPQSIPLAQEQGKHFFRYAICPVKREAVAKECYEFLFPLINYHKIQTDTDPRQDNQDLTLFTLSDSSIIPLAIKVADDKNGVIIRLLETEGKEKIVELKLNQQFKSAEITNLLEETIEILPIKDQMIRIPFKGQEIITILLKK